MKMPSVAANNDDKKVEYIWDKIAKLLRDKNRHTQFRGLINLYEIVRSESAVEIAPHCKAMLDDYLSQNTVRCNFALARIISSKFSPMTDDEQNELKVALLELREASELLYNLYLHVLSQMRSTKTLITSEIFLDVDEFSKLSINGQALTLLVMSESQRKQLYQKILKVKLPKSIDCLSSLLPYLSDSDRTASLKLLCESLKNSDKADNTTLCYMLGVKLKTKEKKDAITTLLKFANTDNLQIITRLFCGMAEHLNIDELEFLLNNLTQYKKVFTVKAEGLIRSSAYSAYLKLCNNEQLVDFFNTHYALIEEIKLDTLPTPECTKIVLAVVSALPTSAPIVEAGFARCEISQLTPHFKQLRTLTKRCDLGRLLAQQAPEIIDQINWKEWCEAPNYTKFDLGVIIGLMPRIPLMQLIPLLKNLAGKVELNEADEIIQALNPIIDKLTLEHLVVVARLISFPCTPRHSEFIARLSPSQIQNWCENLVHCDLGHADTAVHLQSLLLLSLLLPRLEKSPHEKIKAQLLKSLESNFSDIAFAALVAYKCYVDYFKKNNNPIPASQLVETLIKPSIALSPRKQNVVRELFKENCQQSELTLALELAQKFTFPNNNPDQIIYLIAESFNLIEIPDACFEIILQCVKKLDKFPDHIAAILSSKQAAAVLSMLPDIDHPENLIQKLEHAESQRLLYDFNQILQSSKKPSLILSILKSLLSRGDEKLKSATIDTLLTVCAGETDELLLPGIFEVFRDNLNEMNQAQRDKLLEIGYIKAQTNLNNSSAQLILTLTLLKTTMTRDQNEAALFIITGFLRKETSNTYLQNCLLLILDQHLPDTYFQNHESLLIEILKTKSPCSLEIWIRFVGKLNQNSLVEWFQAVNASLENITEEYCPILLKTAEEWFTTNPPVKLVMQLLKMIEPQNLEDYITKVYKEFPTWKMQRKDLPFIAEALAHAARSENITVLYLIAEIYLNVEDSFTMEQKNSLVMLQKKPITPPDEINHYRTALGNNPLKYKLLEILVNPDQADYPITQLLDYLRALAQTKPVITDRYERATAIIVLFCEMTTNIANIRSLYKILFSYEQQHRESIEFFLQAKRSFILIPEVLDLTSGYRVECNDHVIEVVECIKARLITLLRESGKQPTAEDQRFMQQRAFSIAVASPNW